MNGKVKITNRGMFLKAVQPKKIPVMANVFSKIGTFVKAKKSKGVFFEYIFLVFLSIIFSYFINLTFFILNITFIFFGYLYFFNDKMLYEASFKAIYLIGAVILGLIFYLLIAILIKAFKRSDINLNY